MNSTKPIIITYLGPAGATFTALAYDKLAELYGAPRSTDEGVELVVAKSNEEVLPLILKHGGYGAIAMETKAEGRVDPPVNSFISLLKKMEGECPIQVIGALKMKINFALMARPGVEKKDIKKVVGHVKALGACRARIAELGAETIESTSNGRAAEEVAGEDSLAYAAALAPIQAAEKYDLTVLDPAFEDREAITTFYLLGPRATTPKPQNPNRSLIVFEVKHIAGALVKVLTPFADEGVSLRLIHSLYAGDERYDFAIETECDVDKVEAHERAIKKAQEYMERWIQFGPFPVVSK